MKGAPQLKERIEQSLEISWKEGIPAAVMLGVMEYYVVPLGLFLGATTLQIGLLVALPHLLGSFSLLFAVQAVRWLGSRLTFTVRTSVLQATLLLPVAALALVQAPGRVELLILLMILFRVLFHLIGPAWGSLMSDYLPPEKRGAYFGRRSRTVGIAQVAAMGLAGLVLAATKKEAPAVGFFLIFFLAALARFLSARYLSKQVDLPVEPTAESEFTFFMFIRRFRESNFVKFVLYFSSISFAAFLAAPYFSVFMLRDMHFDYLTYSMIHLFSVAASFLSLPIWGRHADVVGNARVLKTTSFMIPMIPLLWLVSRNPYWLIAVEMFSGFAWGGFGLCATNFIYDAVTPAKRVRCLAYFNLINGVAVFAGASLGGILADRLPPLLGWRLLTLFALSGALRFAAHFFLSRRFEEVRASHRKVSSLQLFFSVLGIRPLMGAAPQNGFPLYSRRGRTAS